MDELAVKIQELEWTLLHGNIQCRADVISKLLAEEFEEIGSDGGISSRNEVVEWLLNKEESCRWTFIDFQLKHLSESMVIAIYKVKKSGDDAIVSSIRSSIWQLNDIGWQMIFHQGTKIKN